MADTTHDAINILGVAEIVLSVCDIEAMAAWYEDVLGFARRGAETFLRPGADDDGRPTIVFLTIHNSDTPLGKNGHPATLALIDYERHALNKGRIVGHDPARTTLHHLAFEIAPDAYETQHRRLEQRGLEPIPTTFKNIGAKSLFIRDPEENVIELICSA